MWNLKFDTNEHSYETETYSDIENKQTCGFQRGGWVGMEKWEFGIGRCKLLYIGWITTSTYYTVQGTKFNIVINHNGKEYEKVYIFE